MGKVKAIIFDLDDTLFDCSGQLVQAARKRAAKVMAGKIDADEQQILKKQNQLYKEFGPSFNVFNKICDDYKLKNKDKCVDAALKAYNSGEVGKISLFNEVIPLLEKLKAKKIKLVLITSGIHSRQQKKIKLLGLREWMDLIFIHDIEKLTVSKRTLFKEAIQALGLKPSECISVGDRIQREIKIGNSMGMTTIRLLQGRFRSMKPKNALEEPDFEIKNLLNILEIVDLVEQGKNHKPKVVAIGGGTGLPMVLNSLKDYTKNLTAIVTVTDSGRSSGMLRKDLHILPPGDIRNCLIALSDSEELLLDLFRYRFDNGGLEGHSFGNLFIAALTKTTGSFEKALKEVSRILAIKGQVLPSTLQDTHICAELEDGTIVEEEFNVRAPDKSPIKRVFLKHKVKPLEDALKAIEEADLIVLGPGSLFTSIIPNLLVEDLSKAIGKSKAKTVYVANIMTQPGQTDSYSLSMHVFQIEKYLGKCLDEVLFNNKKPTKELIERYKKDDAFIVENDPEKICKDIKLVPVDLLEKESNQVLWQKQYLLRHDPEKLGKALLDLV
ncbi:MAG: hypothetical protein CL943_02415 [Candidatus Diapherotrites archaeon]|uniref:Gluconeogenesis factor n=1 Tax=Candidatus Iainarchaeum sp. TaxID=3101447 RepID=A0A2D6M139_9ARCH|nr:hypothetical protein [Candidatus Diapherotrites archaeon]|tara:strand:+ start:7584 stop:9242 length:1659 start_codon:yes stop_codon:yes gene_type:complete